MLITFDSMPEQANLMFRGFLRSRSESLVSERKATAQEEGKRILHVSLERDIRPLFRAVDVSRMKAHGIKLDDYTFMSDPDNADKVHGTLSPAAE